MHEFSIMSEIVKRVIAEAEKAGAVSVKETMLELGELTFLGQMQLKFSYDVLAKGTILEGSKLRIRGKKIKVACANCKYKGPVKYNKDPAYHMIAPLLNCPKCKGPVEITSGKECLIKSIKLVTNDDDKKDGKKIKAKLPKRKMKRDRE